MKSLAGAIVLAIATSTASFAQQPAALGPASAIMTDEAAPAKKVTDRKFWILGAALNTAMLLDTKSTFDVSKRCADCYEANPVVAPFVAQGQATTYIAGEAFDAGVMALAARMKASDRAWARRTWWVIPVALITGHTIAYRHNVNLAR
jgi:hypothetical protein